MKNVDVEFKILLGDATDDDSAMVSDDGPQGCFDKFFRQDALETDGHISVAKLEAETAEPNARLSQHYQKIAQAAAATVAPPNVSGNLAKRARDPRCKKIEETVYPSGSKVVAEMDDHNRVIRTYAVEGDE